MKEEKRILEVLTEDKIRQKMAGYKAAYQRRVNAAKTPEEKAGLERDRDAWIEQRRDEILKLNRKAIQQRAGRLSWITRRINAEISGDPEAILRSMGVQEEPEAKPARKGPELAREAHRCVSMRGYRCAMGVSVRNGGKDAR